MMVNDLGWKPRPSSSHWFSIFGGPWLWFFDAVAATVYMMGLFHHGRPAVGRLDCISNRSREYQLADPFLLLVFYKTTQKRLDEEMNQLMVDIRRIGEDGAPEVTFGELFDDDDVQQYYEALVGTLKCAKKRGLVEYKGILLLKGVSDDVVISIKNAGE